MLQKLLCYMNVLKFFSQTYNLLIPIHTIKRVLTDRLINARTVKIKYRADPFETLKECIIITMHWCTSKRFYGIRIV